MKTVNWNYFSCAYTLLLFVTATTAIAQSPEVVSIDSLIDRCVESKFINGDILIVENKKPFYKRTVGYRDNARKETLRPNSLFNIGSVSKPFTAVAIMKLQEKKLLNINDPVNKYLPSFPYDDILIRHLLSHTSGIIENIELDDNDKQTLLTNDSLMALLNKYKPQLQYKPGDKWSYSNLGYDLLAIIVERITKLRFDEYMQKNIFQPAGMYRTFIPRTRDFKQWMPPTLNEKSIALPHSFENIASCIVTRIDEQANSTKERFYFYGSTNVYTTVYDLAKFDEALATNKILSKASQQIAYTPYRLNDGSFAVDSLAPILSYYGLGWEISIDTSWGKIIWHKGRSGGTRTVFLRNPDRKQMVALADNNDNANSDLKAIACLKIVNHQPYKNPLYKSLVQQLGCDIATLGFDAACKNFVARKETQKQDYYFSKAEMVDLATVLDSRNDLNSALAVLKLGYNLFPDHWMLLITYGDLLLKANRTGEAVPMYRNAVSHYSANEKERISLLESIGSQFIDAGRLGDAEIVLKINTELFPNDCNSYDNYAYILDKNNKLDLAIIAQQNAVDLATQQKDTLLNILTENLGRLKAKK